MALDKTRMATGIADKMISAGIITSDKKAEVIVIWKEICDGIISEITANADVSTNVKATYLVSDDVTGNGTGGVA